MSRAATDREPGVLLFWAIPSAPTVDPVSNAYVTERLTELVVVISLMGAGLKLDRQFPLVSWSATWRLLVVAIARLVAVVA